MGLELRLAWRNVWRNPRRTGLTVAATVFAVVLVVVSVAMAAGVHEQMIEDSVRVGSGHLSLSGAGYLEEQTLEQYLRFDEDVIARLENADGVQAFAPRIIAFGLLSEESATRGVGILGVDPAREGLVSTLPDRVREGHFLRSGESGGIVLGQRLAGILSAEVGDEVLLYSMAYTLESAYELFRVVGIMRLPEPNMDRSLAIISLEDAQRFYVYDDRITEVAVLAKTADGLPALRAELADGLTARGIEVHTWQETMPELEQLIFLDDAGMYIVLVILVVVVAFGILNTILMAVLERKRELGVVLALGLRPGAVFRIVYLESMFLAVVGLVVGLAIALPLVLYLQANPVQLGAEAAQAMELFGVDPVMTWKLKPLNPIGSAITILGVAIVAALYPALKASRGQPVDVLRSL